MAWTRVVLAEVRPAQLARSTPCPSWRLGDLLVHLADGLDAFTEAAGGRVALTPAPRPLDPLGADLADAVRERASALLGAWAAQPPPGGRVGVGDGVLPGSSLVVIAALELTVHACDVARAIGQPTAPPEPLAADLLAVAQAVIDPADRGVRFAAVRPVPPGASYADRLLAWTGRACPEMTGPGGSVHREPRTGRARRS
nr:TIGR03086 family metal-binding protein [Nocardioides flavescens]